MWHAWSPLPSYDSHDFSPPLKLVTESDGPPLESATDSECDGPPSLELAMDSVASPSPYESVYDADSWEYATVMSCDVQITQLEEEAKEFQCCLATEVSHT